MITAEGASHQTKSIPFTISRLTFYTVKAADGGFGCSPPAVWSQSRPKTRKIHLLMIFQYTRPWSISRPIESWE